MPESSTPSMPASNADSIAKKLVWNSMPQELLNPGAGYEELFQVIHARIEEVKTAYRAGDEECNEAFQLMLNGAEEWKLKKFGAALEEARSRLLNVRCTKWFLARLFQTLSEYLEERFSKNSVMPSIVYCHSTASLFSTIPMDRSITAKMSTLHEPPYT